MTDNLEQIRSALGDRYRVEGEIGSGGMATVYLAEDLKHRRRVAVKVLKPEVAAAFGTERFLKEIQIAAGLQHPNILALYDSGEAEGLLYYVMPYVEGESLRERLIRERQLPLEDALQVVSQIAEGLAYAHSLGVIHRDIKPENVLLSGEHAVLADFGIARAATSTDDRPLTETGLTVGTPAYMSPEQASGDQEVDHRTDIYSLACVLYEALGGEPPHTGPTPQAVLARKLTERARPLAPIRTTVTPELDDAIRRSLSPAPADRHATAYEFKRALEAPPRTTARLTRPSVEISLPRPALSPRVIVWTVLAALAVVVGVLVVRGLGPPGVARDGRVGLAVFPFRPAGGEAQQWSEQLPDLLATVLDGTPGVRVADPWALWRTLRPDRSARAESPVDPREAERLALEAGADRFILGSLTAEAGRFNVAVRVYRAGMADPINSLSVGGSADSVGAMIQRLAVQLITVVWPRDSVPTVPELDRYATQSADALKAYLQAKEAMRRGRLFEAEAAIDTALTLDSTFAIALVEATGIKSWSAALRGEFYYLMDLATRAAQYSDSLSERNRLRARATLASVRTEGFAAAEAASRILELDSTDVDAWRRLGYYHTVYGWQYGADERDAAAAMDRALRLDSTSVPTLVSRASLALQIDGVEAAGRYVEQLLQIDTASALARNAVLAHRSLALTDREFGSFVDSVAGYTPREWRAVLGALRNDSLGRAMMFLETVLDSLGPGISRNAIALEQGRLLVGVGSWSEMISSSVSGSYADSALGLSLARLTVAASLSGLIEDDRLGPLVASLDTYTPPESAVAYWGQRPVWWNGWIVGAYNAMYGDTSLAVRWEDAFLTLPAGGTSQDYRGSLKSDLMARRLARKGDMAGALIAAKRAFDLWSIHTENTQENGPEPAMRFHYGMLLRANGQPDSASNILRSLVPPTTWLGFLTARASLELGQIAEESGDLERAARHYSRALNMWRHGGPESDGWRSRARDGLQRSTGERVQ